MSVEISAVEISAAVSTGVIMLIGQLITRLDHHLATTTSESVQGQAEMRYQWTWTLQSSERLNGAHWNGPVRRSAKQRGSAQELLA
jgi:hypothetical protein